jgi:hypothetical protein
MEQPTNNDVALPEESGVGIEETLSRRRLLKAIAAASGAVAASTLLPGEWIKPVVEAGVLPAHAQVSGGPFTISGVTDPAAGPQAFCTPPRNFVVVSATISPVPPVGSIVSFTITTDCTLVSVPPPLSGSAPTDASGTATFNKTFTITAFGPSGTIVITFTFGASTFDATYTDVGAC